MQSKNKFMLKGKNKNKKGFSLPETMVAILIFSIAMTMVSGSFAGFLRNYVSEKRQQKAIEDAQYALNLMEKTIRTSVLSTSNPAMLKFNTSDNKMIKLFDNSQSKCLAYLYDDVNRKIKVLTKPGSDSGIEGCGDFINGYTSSDMTSGSIVAVTADGWPSSVGKPGRVSISLAVKEGINKPITVGTTASLRDFERAPSCTDGIRNGAETAIDCGGSCGICP